ncbi:hypothetical protein O1R50_08235 [Glycomyces luteolus]|uniref:GNAT family N-acetyltransferase n=1 Tax=Glycomyces luteolus TaxID=2670330 RepID=A0A9X3SPQ3_9ACTN|nr:hypothetical protein [Glycomyces luteolus]MDA1359607.1 hypothetical protein [Glycomyces luteolus]
MWRDLVQQAEAVITRKAELDFTVAAGEDPSAVFRRFGASIATRLPMLPQRVPYNKVRGYQSADHRMLNEVIEFYADTGVRPTLPDFRRRGCQAALINRRLADAREDNGLVVVTAAYASPSHDNLARYGFGITHTRTVWQ